MPRITSGEIGAALARIEAHQEAMIERVGRIEAKLDAAPTMRDLEPVHARVRSLEAAQTWVVRSIIGAMVTGLGALVLALATRLRLGVLAWMIGAVLALAPGPTTPGARVDRQVSGPCVRPSRTRGAAEPGVVPVVEAMTGQCSRDLP